VTPAHPSDLTVVDRESCSAASEMKTVQDLHGEWQGHDYWLLSVDGAAPLIFFAPTLRVALVLNGAAFDAIARGSIPETVEMRLRAALPKALAPAAAPPTAFHLGLGLTRDCTLACRYCHAEAGTSQEIEWTTLHGALQYAVAAAAQTPEHALSVSFAVGGEPTMPWALFTRAVLELERMVAESVPKVEALYLSMTTNGYYGADRRVFVAEHFQHVTVSLDGDEAVQNLHRPDRAGRGSYRVVSETVKHFLARRELHLGLRGTVSAESVSRLPDIVCHFACEFGDGYAVGFEPLVPLGRALGSAELHPPDQAEFTEMMREARAIGADLGINVTSSAPSLRRLVTQYCGAMSIPSFAVCVDGQITACHRDQDALDYGYGLIGSQSGEVRIDNERLAGLARVNSVPDECQSCFARWQCAGDCPDLRRIGWSRCAFNRALLHDEIVELLTKSEGGEVNG
jgi:uncharacterized protein